MDVSGIFVRGEPKDKEKDEGSLSISIVPIESWETVTDGSQWVGKGKNIWTKFQMDVGS